MADSEKLVGVKKAYAGVILNKEKEAVARVMVAERAFRYQRELAYTKEDAVRMLVKLKQMMDSRIYEADMVTSRQRSKIDELEAQLHEAEDIVKDLRDELSIVGDELYYTKRKLSQQMREQQANHIVIRGTEEQGEEFAPSIDGDDQALNAQMGDAARSEQETSESIRDGHCETLFSSNFNMPPNVVLVKEVEMLSSRSPQRMHILGSEGLSNNDDIYRKSHSMEDENAVRERCEGGIKSVPLKSSAEHFVSWRRSLNLNWIDNDKKSNTGIYPAMKLRAHNLRCKKAYSPSSLNKRKSLAKQFLKSLKKTNLNSKSFATSAVQSVGFDTAGSCLNTVLCGPVEPCDQSALKNEISKIDRASTGSADSSVTCADAEVACVPSFSVVEESDELAFDDARRPKNDRPIKFTFQRKRKKDCMDSADEDNVVAVKRFSGREIAVKPSNNDSYATGRLARSSCQSDDKEDTLKEFKRSLKRKNIDKQEFK